MTDSLLCIKDTITAMARESWNQLGWFSLNHAKLDPMFGFHSGLLDMRAEWQVQTEGDTSGAKTKAFFLVLNDWH